MNKKILMIMLILSASLLLTGCSRKADENAVIVKEAVPIEKLPSCIKLGEYKGVKVEIPAQAQITEKDIQEQIDYALNKAGETSLNKENVKVISGCSTIEQYKNAIKENLEKLNESSLNNEIMNKAWDAALSNATLLKCPQKMLDVQLAAVKADDRAKAINFVKSDIMVYAIAKAENITVSDEEYKAEVEKRMKYFNVSTEEELAKMLGGSSDLHFVFLADKVMQFVYKNAKTVIDTE